MANNSILDSNTDEGRFAISLLAKNRLNEALPEEVLIDHETGELIVKDINGKMTSFPYGLRVNLAYERFLKTMRDNFIYGIMRELNPNDTKKLPYRLNEDENILDSSIKLTTNLKRGLLVQLDIDVIDNYNMTKDTENKIKYNDIRMNTNGINVEVLFSISYSNSEGTNITNNITYQGYLDKFNSNIFIPQYFTGYDLSYSNLTVSIDSIKVNRLSEDSTKNLTIILYNILYSSL